jgi:hypothetical protein
MICRQVLLFPQSSVALQVRLIVYSCGQFPAMVTSVDVIVGVASQLSVAVAVPLLPPGAVLAVHSMVILGGQNVITGGVLSSTKMVWRHVLELPQSSVARQVLLIVYSCGHAPATVTSVDVIVGVASQLSVAVAVPFAPPGAVLAVHWIVRFGGHVITGGVLSSTKMVCRHVLELPQSSVAIHVRVMVYSCGHAPPTVTSVDVIVGVASQLSVAVAVPFAPPGAVLAEH